MREFLVKKDAFRWELSMEAEKGMRVPGFLYADNYIIEKLEEENALVQVANVACLPGIKKYSFAMPDIHWGYGFAIGGVAAFDEEDGIISPGGVGYDISCGVRLLSADLTSEEARGSLHSLTSGIFTHVPCGLGSRVAERLNRKELDNVLQEGSVWALKRGYASRDDLAATENGGCLEDADPGRVSEKAKERGKDQLGTLGSGNHFIEIQVIENVYDIEKAALLGLKRGSITVMIHCGSRGLGHQVCDDNIRAMSKVMAKYGIEVPDRQLVSVPIQSPEGRSYFGAMYSAANFAIANRQIITKRVRDVFEKIFPGRELRLVYDISHNMAHMEEHIDAKGDREKLCVHRKGATRALPPGHGSLYEPYLTTGQPVLIPGSMGTASYILTGTGRAAAECFASTCHGAGRVLSRHAARKTSDGHALRQKLEDQGISVMAGSYKTLSEETPLAYKDVDHVVDVVDRAGISCKIARLVPLAVIKG